VVAAGLTIALPEAGREPPPGDMDIDVAPETLQPRFELPPELMLAGLAVKELITGEVAGGEVGGGEVGGSEVAGGEVDGGEVGGSEVAGGEVGADGVVTAIVTDRVTLPAALVAVMI
jgi:hypothetical protein